MCQWLIGWILFRLRRVLSRNFEYTQNKTLIRFTSFNLASKSFIPLPKLTNIMTATITTPTRNAIKINST
jgi:hypothetical protein